MEINYRERENVTKVKTMEEVITFFESCKAFWMRQGDAPSVATCKAFWWDCVEAWNFDRVWNDAKEKFAMEFRGYKPGDEVPSEEKVKKGAV